MTGTQHPGQLPAHLRRPFTPDQQRIDYLAVLEAAIAAHPRSLQTQLGPSELGDPCNRRIGYKLLGTPERPQPPNWKATVGTAGHAWAEAAFDADNLQWPGIAEGHERWLIETELTVGFVPGYGFITGHADLYDRATATNLDHKFVGRSMLAHYRKDGPDQQYRTQAHLYGLGWELAGYPIEQVGIVFLPRDGELADTHLWSEPYSRPVAEWALRRLTALVEGVRLQGVAALDEMPTADAYCGYCPFYRPNNHGRLAEGCAGHAGRIAAHTPALTVAPATPTK